MDVYTVYEGLLCLMCYFPYFVEWLLPRKETIYTRCVFSHSYGWRSVPSGEKLTSITRLYELYLSRVLISFVRSVVLVKQR